jgi:KDO2-lipid IV(A) lauroyltransferase
VGLILYDKRMQVLRWFSRCPLVLLHVLGSALGWIAWAASSTYRTRLRANARLARVDDRTRRRAIAEAGRMVAETPWLWLRPDDGELERRCEWIAPERLDATVAAGRPLVMLTPHMGSFEVAARAFVDRYGQAKPLTVLYRPARRRSLREFQAIARARPGLATAPANLAGVRQMLRALRRGECVGLLPDQVPPEGQGVWAPFFRLPAYTMTLAARLVQQTGADCLVLRCERLPRGRGFRLHTHPLARPLPAGSDLEALTQAATVINETMEQVILQDPGQYLWGYNRYKQPRPADTPGTDEEAAR